MKIMSLYLLAGLVSGIADKWADESADIVGPLFGSFLGSIGTAAGLWIVVLVAISLTGRQSIKRAIVGGIVYFLGLCIGYYMYSQFVLGYSGLGVLVFWLLASITVVPGFIALVLWARQNLETTLTGKSYLAMVVVGFVAAIPFAQTIGSGFDLTDPTPADIGVNLHSAVQIIFACIILLLLVRGLHARIITGIITACLVWPVFLLFDGLWKLMTVFSQILH